MLSKKYGFRLVPVQVAEQSATAIVKPQPVAHEGYATVALAGFVTEMGPSLDG